MMKYGYWLLIALFVQSCSSGDKQPSQDDQPLMTEEQEHRAEKHRIENPNETIELNNGEKWKADPEMVAHVEVIQIILEDFAPEGLGDYYPLAEVIDAELAALIKSCTMKGQGHDELHKWLLPVMQKVEALGKTEDPKMAEALVVELEEAMQEFHEYFEKG